VQTPPPRPQHKPQSNPYTNPFSQDLHEAMRRQQAYAEAERVRRHAAEMQEQARQKAARARARAQNAADEAARQSQQGPGFGPDRELLDQLKAVSLSGVLNTWECQFANDVCERYRYDSQLSDKQLAIIRKILAKTTFARGRG
jgi:regulator of protease activity HflC (stomatin/prohibitin superfamily)